VPRACCLIRPAPHYRSEAFIAGLKAAGYEVTTQLRDPRPGDVLVGWNRYGTMEDAAGKFERAGGRVLIVENGYIGKDHLGRQLYAIAEGQHNGAGRWVHRTDTRRFHELDNPPLPWRRSGSHILVTAQRGIGSRTMASPHRWAEDVANRLRTRTKREVRIRQHPEDRSNPSRTPLEEDLQGAHAVVTWASGAAVRAIIAVIPVFYEAPHWILEGAARKGIDDIENPWTGDRTPHLERMAWAQWSVEEIASGVPFRLLLQKREEAA
jgi:hypothetical protein